MSSSSFIFFWKIFFFNWRPKEISETLNCQKECHKTQINGIKDEKDFEKSEEQSSSFSFKIQISSQTNSSEELLSGDEISFLSTVCKAVEIEGIFIISIWKE
jgi:hypothetical protein